MRIAEAARLLDVSAVTVRRLDAAGKIHVVRDRNGHRRFDEKSLQEARNYLYPQKADETATQSETSKSADNSGTA